MTFRTTSPSEVEEQDQEQDIKSARRVSVQQQEEEVVEKPRRGFGRKQLPQTVDEENDELKRRVEKLEGINQARTVKSVRNIAFVMIPDHGNMVDHTEPFIVDRDDATKTTVAIFKRTNAIKKALFKVKEIKVPFNDALAFPTPSGWLAFFDVKNYDQIPPTTEDRLREMVSKANRELKSLIQDILIMNETGNQILAQKPSWWEKYGLQFAVVTCVLMSSIAMIYLASQLPTIGQGTGTAIGHQIAVAINQTFHNIAVTHT